jgi:hypothetical protein
LSAASGMLLTSPTTIASGRSGSNGSSGMV